MRTQPISQSTVVPCMIHPPPPVRYLTTKRLPHGPAPLSSCAQQQASIHRLLSTYLDVAPSSEVVALYAPGACTTLPPKVPDPYLQGLTDIPKQTDFSHNRTRPMCRRIRSGTGPACTATDSGRFNLDRALHKVSAHSERRSPVHEWDTNMWGNHMADAVTSHGTPARLRGTPPGLTAPHIIAITIPISLVVSSAMAEQHWDT